jgi:hypothetical protein
MAGKSEAELPTSLADVGATSFAADPGLLTDRLPVIVVHARRGRGATTLIGKLLNLAQDGYGVTGAVVLCDRPAPGGYLSGIVPPDVVVNKAPEAVLAELIRMQGHSARLAQPVRERLALVLDDVLYTAKDFASESFQCDLKRAADYDIMVIITTPNAGILPPNLHTFATHVMASQCVFTQEPKVLQQRMFGMFDDAKGLASTLALCRDHEYLVGLLAAAPGANLRAFVVTLPLAPLRIDPKLVAHLAHTLAKLPSK